MSWGMFRRCKCFGLPAVEDEEALEKHRALRERLDAAAGLFEKLDSGNTGQARAAMEHLAAVPRSCCNASARSGRLPRL